MFELRVDVRVLLMSAPHDTTTVLSPPLETATMTTGNADVRVEIVPTKKDRPIITFDGAHRWLRNEWACSITFEGITYPSAAHAFAASGTDDIKVRQKISKTEDWKKAEYIAKSASTNFTFDHTRVDKLAQILLIKFIEPGLRTKLKITDNHHLIYRNARNDTVWGVCNDRGFNFLGRTLMEVRSFIINKDSENAPQ